MSDNVRILNGAKRESTFHGFRPTREPEGTKALDAGRPRRVDSESEGKQDAKTFGGRIETFVDDGSDEKAGV